MTLQSRTLILAASLFAVPLAGAMAQSNPAGNYGSNKSMTAAPGTADSKAASGLSTADSATRPPAMTPGAMNPYKPGATGNTVVPGTNSSVANIAPNSAEQKSGATATGK